MSGAARICRTADWRDRLALLATAIAATIGLIAAVSLIGGDRFIRWGAMAGFSALLFGVLLSGGRPGGRSVRLWSCTALFAVLHLAAWVWLLNLVPGWRLPWFFVMVAEIPIFDVCYGMIPPATGSADEHRGRQETGK